MKAWLFDVDGVITNINTKKIDHPEIINKISKKLESSEPVGLITGRRLATTLENVINPIKKSISNPQVLRFLHGEAEFGSVEIVFREGKEIIKFDDSFKLPEKLTLEGKKIIENYKDFVFFNQKNFFYTAEMNDHGNQNEFKLIQTNIADELQKLIQSLNLSSTVEVHKDTIAINVKRKDLNKHHATKNLINWLKSENLNPEEFYVFGDSESDFQIGQELHDQNKKLKFIYTGEKKIDKKPFEVINVGKFDKGTLEYLTSN